MSLVKSAFRRWTLLMRRAFIGSNSDSMSASVQFHQLRANQRSRNSRTGPIESSQTQRAFQEIR
jgi:hypothetical protein